MSDALKKKIEKVRERITRAALRSGKDPSEIILVAVAKYANVELLERAVEFGLTDVGENRADQLVEKHRVLGDRVRWHFVGHLQSNKVKKVIGIAEYIHSLDRMSTAWEIRKRAGKLGRTQKVLIEVNVAQEETKIGIAPGELYSFCQEIVQVPHLDICGLMTLAPLVEDPEEVRGVFRDLRQMRDDLAARGIFPNFSHLSMGMTNDFEVAIEEGATMVRVGSAIFC
ncbi:YggS family pyridoxal phosphate-dependent enzyme [Candidatus Hakubella thermalkaliphila]|uniref:YggS family pyridoxal phosphate-dependent enzyme n=1 Tax=Candidatus Hakubella thermalkaliphila TaxID=2754717 RepID=UPI00159328AF|nr:YggS family pyridoxal phosphate-dependent enzyme [Candidatus Hakubella thermalkaliphila]